MASFGRIHHAPRRPPTRLFIPRLRPPASSSTLYLWPPMLMYVGQVNHCSDPKVDMDTSGAAWTPEPPMLFARMAFVGHFQPRALQGPPGHQNRQFCLPDWSFGAPGPAGAPEL